MTDRPRDIDEIRSLCAERHPHSPDETVAWLAVHRLLREIDREQAAVTLGQVWDMATAALPEGVGMALTLGISADGTHPKPRAYLFHFGGNPYMMHEGDTAVDAVGALAQAVALGGAR